MVAKKIFVIINFSFFLYAILSTNSFASIFSKTNSNKNDIKTEKVIKDNKSSFFSKFKRSVNKIKKHYSNAEDESKLKIKNSLLQQKYMEKQKNIQIEKQNIVRDQDIIQDIKDITDKEQENEKEKSSKIRQKVKKIRLLNIHFINHYIIPEKNPAFGGRKNSISITYGYDIDRLHGRDEQSRHLHALSIDYSAPFRLLGIHARYSIGLFALFGKDEAAINMNEGKYHHLGVEFYPEFVFGHKNLYITAGCGMSYVFSGGPMTYASYHKAEASGIKNSGQVDENSYDGMTYFNWVLKAAIGHRFDNGLVLEAIWKHYSNGGLGLINYDVNSFGISLSYTFSFKL